MEDEDEDECVVCYNPTANRLSPCNHIVCLGCAELWVVRSVKCPVCRHTLVSLQLPDIPVQLQPLPLDISSSSKTPTHAFAWCRRKPPAPPRPFVIVYFPPGTHAGITFANADQAVRVSRLIADDQCARHGLRKGDLVTYLNDIPVTDHARAAAISDAARDAGIPLKFTLAIPKKKSCMSMLDVCLTNVCVQGTMPFM